jgi:hypothetical protein
MTWSVQEYTDELRRNSPRCSGQNENLEERILRMFPPTEKELVVLPAVVTDKNGLVLLWYLPGLLSRRRRVSPLRFQAISSPK